MVRITGSETTFYKIFIRGGCCMPGTGIVVSFDGTVFLDDSRTSTTS